MLECRREAGHDGPMKLSGDPEGIAALRALHEREPTAVKVLIEDVSTTTDNATTFRDDDGNRWRMSLDPKTGELYIERAPPLSSRPPPPSTKDN
jgi:hypothetical protein